MDDCSDGSDEAGRICATFKERCPFTKNFCHWTQDVNDTMDWTIGFGSSPLLLNAPVFDHSSGTLILSYQRFLYGIHSKFN